MSAYLLRPMVHIGKDTGALPGNLDEKDGPYIAPFFDNLEVLFSDRALKRRGRRSLKARIDRITSNRKRKKAMAFVGQTARSKREADSEDSNKVRKPVNFALIMDRIEAMTFIRGRSLANTIFIIDEAQNLTPHEAKTVVGWMAEGSKVILLGDPLPGG